MLTSTTPINPHQLIEQLGGAQFRMMVGARGVHDIIVSSSENYVRIKFKGSKVANIMYVTLNEMDTYNVQFGKYRGDNYKVVSDHKNIYDDQLRGLFEKTTLLRTSLTKTYGI
jgi:hypothetical protein